VREFVKKLNREHDVTVILTTHDMDDIEALCQRIIILGNGKILNDSSLQSLRANISTERRIKLELQDNVTAFDIDHATVINRHGRTLEIAFNPEIITSAALISDIVSRYEVLDLLVENPPIENLISELYASNNIASQS
jgi:ABC-2 type transport system ATP-binding protein